MTDRRMTKAEIEQHLRNKWKEEIALFSQCAFDGFHMSPPENPHRGMVIIVDPLAVLEFFGMDLSLGYFTSRWNFFSPQDGMAMLNKVDDKVYVYREGSKKTGDKTEGWRFWSELEDSNEPFEVETEE